MAKSINTANIDPAVKDVLQALLLDVTALRTAHATLTAKLDLDATVTDTDYAAATNPAAPNTSK